MKNLSLSVGKKKKKGVWKFLPILLIAAIVIGLIIFIGRLSGSNSTSVFNYILSGTSLNSTDNKVNVVLLGIAGGTHDGSTLTDTILVASYNLKTNNLYLISIPRDLWLPSLKSKANAAYQMGQSEGKGLDSAKVVFGNVLGLPIHYGLRIDFRGFVQAIDALGGIEVEVDKSFDDYLYPIQGKEDDLCGFREEEKDFSEEEAKSLNIEPGKKRVFIAPDGKIATDSAEEDKGVKYFSCRYEHISFQKGKMQMGGAVALKYVRSRHGTNGEGSDFARSKRQEKVIQAIRNKILSAETLFNPRKLSELLGALGKSVDTDISVTEALEFYKLSKDLTQTHNITLDNSRRANLPEGRTSLLIQPPAKDYGGAFVLVSEDDDFSIIQEYVKKVLQGEINEATSSARSGSR